MRLIDADLFMEELLSMKMGNKELPLLDDDPEVNNYDVGQEETFDLVIRNLSEQPTVYARTPMANIVEKLEEESYETTDTVCGGRFKAIRLSTAINIVKQEINNGLE